MPRKARDAQIVRIPVVPVRDAVHFPGQINTLHVARDLSLRALRKAMDGDRLVVVVSQRDMAMDEPGPEDIYEVGTLSEVLQSIPLPDTTQRAALRGLERVRLCAKGNDGNSLWATVEPIHEMLASDLETQALMRTCLDSFTRIVHLDKTIPPEALQSVVHLDDPGQLADTILHHASLRPVEKQGLLETADQKARLEGVMRLLKREEQVLVLNEQIHQKVQRELGESQREFYLREQLRIIEHELRNRGERLDETEEYARRIDAAGMPEEVREAALTELSRLDRSPAASQENLVVRSYLDTLVGLPWAVTSEDNFDVNAAEALLNVRHHGLQKVKDRILDYLAVRQLRKTQRGPILCFVGPPGVGKTSLGRSIAEAMGRRFTRISLGGVRDEAEIRGHRRTYVGSMPGRLIQGIKDCGTRNPVFLLDEIDKIGGDGHGDPSHALLEALDTDQNSRFVDHYVDEPFDLGEVLFIATANLAESIPAPLRDRMEIIHFSSYTDVERFEIARRYLLPAILEEHGLSQERCEVREDALRSLAQEYTREAGVRDLRRQLAAVCRKSARSIASGQVEKVTVHRESLGKLLGPPIFRRIAHERREEVGTAWSMVVTEAGGEIVPIEALVLPRAVGRGEMRLTGNLGQVMQESAQAALSAVKYCLPELSSNEIDIHIHAPEGAVPKEGPSAGVTIACALASALRGVAVRSDTAMTGEVTLHGRVLPVGGIGEKVLAAQRVGLTRVLIPKANLPEIEELPAYVRQSLEIIGVEQLDEVLSLSFLDRP